MSFAESAHDMPWLGMRRLVFAVLVLCSTAAGSWVMFEILQVNGITLLQSIILILFVITFGWITIAFWTAIAGFLPLLSRRDPATLARLSTQTNPTNLDEQCSVLVMPIHNEDPMRLADGLAGNLADKVNRLHFLYTWAATLLGQYGFMSPTPGQPCFSGG